MDSTDGTLLNSIASGVAPKLHIRSLQTNLRAQSTFIVVCDCAIISPRRGARVCAPCSLRAVEVTQPRVSAMVSEEQPPSAWEKSRERRQQAAHIAAILFLLYALRNMISVAGDPPSLHFSFGLVREFINFSIIFGLLNDNESWKLALLGLVVLQAVIIGAILVHTGAVLAVVLLVSFVAGTIGLVMFYESRRLIILWTLLMAAWPVYLLSDYLRLLS